MSQHTLQGPRQTAGAVGQCSGMSLDGIGEGALAAVLAFGAAERPAKLLFVDQAVGNYPLTPQG